ncbi:MFS transporter [uncultured Veillonella sp.]|uniref:MFS transporter n=1 Tax=uncultured Veillonella sp. TaxID=159268 RepID=UPI002614EE77|nr:MFS transporter [uncultured Veillonella sp.]
MKALNFTRTQVLVLATIWLSFLLSFVVRLSWSTLMPIVNEAMQFTPLQGTSYVTAFYIGYALMVLPGGIIADRIGYRKTILFSLFSMALITGLMSTITSYTMGWVLRLLLGLVSGPVQSSCLSAIGDHFSNFQRGTAVGIFMSCTSFGIFTVNLYAPTVATHYGWRMAFLVTAILPLLVLGMSYFTLVRAKKADHEIGQVISERPARTVQNMNGAYAVKGGEGVTTQKLLESPAEQRTFGDGAEKSSVSVGAKQRRPEDIVGTSESTLWNNLKYLLTNRNIMLLAITGFFATGTTWGVTNWTNLYMVKNLGVTSIFAGSVMTIYGLAALMVKPTIGILSDMLPIKKNHLAAICLFCFGPALILFASTINPHMLYVTGAILGIGAFMYSPLTNALVVQSAPSHLRGTTAGFVNLFNQMGSITAPMILGSILAYTGHYQTALYTISVFPVVGSIVLLFVKLKK